jgi:CheY-like chemotaxis protein
MGLRVLPSLLPAGGNPHNRAPVLTQGVARQVDNKQRSRRILVVDDNPDTAESFARVLRAMGHEVESVTDPLDALPAARRVQPELVFLDIGMPLLDGYELARALRKAFGCIVAVTGHGMPEDRPRARVAGFDAHVTKPVDPDVIESIVKTIFNP